jgi:predicted metalloprotease
MMSSRRSLKLCTPILMQYGPEYLHSPGARYTSPTLVLYRGSTMSGCGPASSRMGPFYCPADREIYVDPGFFEDLKIQHRAGGDFAQAYVLAHEVGHHVQNLEGTLNKVQKQFGILEEGDLEEALVAAAAIGDDRLQKQARGFSIPHTFTHGSSKQRVAWFSRGFKNGNLQDCDTF